MTSVFMRWIIVTFAVASTLAGLLWYARREQSKKIADREETTASKALHDIRTGLSQYAVMSSDQYPPSLGALGNRSAQALQEARKVS